MTDIILRVIMFAIARKQYNTMDEGEEGVSNYKEIVWNETAAGKEVWFISFQPEVQ